MIKIVKNTGQCYKVKGKYIFMLVDKHLPTMYAEIGLRPIYGHLLHKIKSRKYR